MFKSFKIRSFEKGLLFRRGEFERLLDSGRHRIFDPWSQIDVRVVSQRDPWLVDDQLDVIAASGALADQATVIDLKQYQRALVWIDGRFARILPSGLYAYWTGFRDVHVEVVDSREVRLESADLQAIVRVVGENGPLDVCRVQRDHAGVLFIDGRFVAEVSPGLYAFWRDAAEACMVEVDLRESQLDVSGQDIMTADKVSLRMNAVVTYRISEPRRSVSAASDPCQALYREIQLALRSLVGTRELDEFLAAKDAVADELLGSLGKRAAELGLEVKSAGIRDVILPGDMRELMNKVTEARKAAEANLIVRREETAAMRSQANTARLLTDNPTLMRLRELEVLEKIAAAGNMNIVLGEKGLADRVVNLL